MGSKGTNTTTGTTGPTPAVASAYQDLMTRAQGVAGTPYQPYTGQLVAPVNAQQTAGINNINQYSGWAQPYFQQAGNMLNNAGQPIDSGQIANYYSPYQQNVINTTQGQFDLMNKQALNNIQGNAAASGALGGDRAGVAKAAYYGAVLPGQEQQIAGLENQGYQSALQTAIQQYQQNPEMVAYGLGNVGAGGQAAALTGANAQVGAGTLEASVQNAINQANYGQYQVAEAFPYSQTQWLAGLQTGVGSQMGGTYSQTGPAPNPLNAIAGIGLTAAGAYFGGVNGAKAGAEAGQALNSARGGRIAGFADGGVPMPTPDPRTREFVLQQIHDYANKVGRPTEGLTGDDIARLQQQIGVTSGRPGFDDGGPVMPYSSAKGWIPGVGIVRGQGAPRPMMPQNQNQQAGFGTPAMTSAAGGIGRGLANWNQGISTDPRGAGLPFADSAAGAAFGPSGYPVTDFADPGIGFAAGPHAAGGRVAGFADGGAPDMVMNGLQDVPPEAMDAWRAGVDADTGRGTTAQTQSGLPPEILQGHSGAVPGSGVGPMSYAPGGIGGGYSPVDDPNSAYNRTGLGAPTRAPIQDRGDTLRQAGFGVPGDTAAQPRGGIAGFLDSLPGRGSLSPAVSQGLMAAGLGMMASKSPFLGVGLGEGGLQGLSAYNAENQREFAQEQQIEQRALEGRKVDLEVNKLKQMANQFQQNLAQQTLTHGYERLPDGSVQPIAGGPADPAQVSALARARGENLMPYTDPNSGQTVFFDKQTGKWVSPPAVAPATPTAGTQTASAGEGIVPANSKLVESGQGFNYGRNAPYMEKGMQTPEPASIGGKSSESIKEAGEYYLQTGKLPGGFPVSRGNSPVAIQQALAANSAINYAGALAASRGLDPQQVPEMWRSAPGMLRFVLGPSGQQTVSLGTAMRHLDTIKDLASEWDKATVNGNWQTVRAIQARISREFGQDAGTNLESAARIVGPEIIKAIGVAGAGTAGERSGAESAFTTAASAKQILGAVNTTQHLMLGQLQGKQNQALAAGVSPERFKSLVGEHEYDRLREIEGGAPTGGAGPARVQTPADAAKLAPGTHYITPDGREMIR